MPLKHFRKYKIVAADVDRVIKHLKLHGKIGANDIILRPLAKPRKRGKQVLHDEPIPWVQPKALMGSWQQKDLANGPAGKLLLYGREDDVWKRIVPVEDVDAYMRHEFLSPDSRMPLSRDSAHHYLLKRTIGISRRHAYSFLEKQDVIQKTRNIPNERQKGGRKLDARGYCEMDLIMGQGRDVNNHLPSLHDDWNWLSLIDNLTGYGVVGLVTDNRGRASKKPKFVARVLAALLDRLNAKLRLGSKHAKVHTLAADHGREFYTDVRKLARDRGIELKQVPRGSRVEKFNQDFQRSFYRLVRLGRGSFSSCQQQAEEITNNLKNKYTKLSPAEAVERRDEEFAERYNSGRETQKAYKGTVPKQGDKCRVLLKMRKNIRPTLKIGSQSRGYKAYHARHFAKGLHKITKILKRDDKDPPALWRYFVNGSWRDRDQILVVSGTDAETDRIVAERKKK